MKTFTKLIKASCSVSVKGVRVIGQVGVHAIKTFTANV